MTDAAGPGRAQQLGKLLRFGIVGSFNTLLDFALLFLFVYAIGFDKYLSNILSTGICLVISFLLNRKWTFKSDGNQRRQFVMFLVVTLIGLWGVQNALIWVVERLLGGWLEGPLLLGVAKLVATVGSLTWNYLLYDRLVFKN